MGLRDSITVFLYQEEDTKKWAKDQREKTEIRKLKMDDHKKLDSMGNINF